MNAPPPTIRQSSSSSSQFAPQPSHSMEMLLLTSGQAARTSRHIQPEGASTVGLRVRRQRPALSISTPSSDSMTLILPRDLAHDLVPSASNLVQTHRSDNSKQRWRPATGAQDITTPDLRVGPPPPWSPDEITSAPRRGTAVSSQLPTSPRSPSSRALTRAWKNVCGALRKPERESSIPQGFVVVSPQTPTAPHRS